ncbi:MAG: hypothetical protein HY080_15630 [Gammaproteobacteria bacterium]|nr:hypothetical protein [Gammaproteobacteria bacterium]
MRTTHHYNITPSLHLSDIITYGDDRVNVIKEVNARNALWFAFGRDALITLAIYLRGMGVKKVLLPSYICDVAVLPFAGILQLDFYEVNPDLILTEELILSKLGDDVGLVLIVDYFGFEQPNKNRIINLCQSKGIRVLDDLAHKAPYDKVSESLTFNIPPAADYALYSLHKQLPIPDGSLLYVRNSDETQEISKLSNRPRGLYRSMRSTIKLLKQTYFGPGADGIPIVTSNSTTVSHEDPGDPWGRRARAEGYRISSIAKHLLKAYRLKTIFAHRCENYTTYLENIQTSNSFIKIRPFISRNDMPYMFPLYLRSVNTNIKLRLKTLLPGYFWPRLYLPIKQDISKYSRTIDLADNVFLLSIQQDLDKQKILSVAELFNKIIAG